MSSFRAGACTSAGRPVSAHSGRKEFIEAIELCRTRVRWTQSFPRTRARPDAQKRKITITWPRAQAKVVLHSHEKAR